MTESELLLITALETMETLKLINNETLSGYYDCRDSLIETSNIIKKILPENKKELLNEMV